MDFASGNNSGFIDTLVSIYISILGTNLNTCLSGQVLGGLPVALVSSQFKLIVSQIYVYNEGVSIEFE